MRMISFSMTTESLLAGKKTVTRRLGWSRLQPGERLLAVKKAMGLKKGEKVQALGTVEVLAVSRERLREITAEDVAREGLEGAVTPAAFVERFCKAMGCTPDVTVTRIEFRLVERASAPPPVSDGQKEMFA